MISSCLKYVQLERSMIHLGRDILLAVGNTSLKNPGERPGLTRDPDLKSGIRTSLVAQWLRIRLPMQGTWFQSLGRDDPTCHGATKPGHHNY